MRAAHVVLAIGLSSIAAAPACATDVIWTFGNGGASGSGQLTFDDSANANGGHLVTAFTGTTYLGTVTALLAPGTVGNDNLLFPDRPANSSLLGTGIGLTIGGANYDLFFSGFTFNNRPLYQFTGQSRAFTFDITPVAATAAVPEPATWAMMIFGFGLVGCAMRRRPRVSIRFA